MGGIFDFNGEDLEETDELKEILEEVIDLYEEILDGSNEDLEKSSIVYEKKYKKLLFKLRDYFDEGFGARVPDFIYELLEELEYPGISLPSRSIVFKTTKIGLKKLLKKFKVPFPEKKEIQKSFRENNVPPIQNIQYLSNEINVSNEIKIEINQAVKEFEEELKKSNPSKQKLKSLLQIIKKGAGQGAIKLLELLIDKIF